MKVSRVNITKMNLLWALVLLIALCSADEHSFDAGYIDSSISEHANKSNINFRLPNTTHPETYDIAITTRIDQGIFDFYGYVRIGIVVDQTTREIVLHARQLTVSDVRLVKYAGNVPINVEIDNHSYDGVTEFLKIRTKNSELLSGDRLTLDITYNGTLRTDNLGFYRSSYINSEGKQV